MTNFSLINFFSLLSDDSWENHRKILEYSFTQDVIQSFVPTFIESTDKMLETLDELEDKTKVDIFKITSRCSLTMVLSTSFGLSATEVQFSDDILKAVEE
jgi:cytochrome P450